MKNKISVSVYNSAYLNTSKSVRDYVMISIHEAVFKSVRHIISNVISNVISNTIYFSVKTSVNSFIQAKT